MGEVSPWSANSTCRDLVRANEHKVTARRRRHESDAFEQAKIPRRESVLIDREISGRSEEAAAYQVFSRPDHKDKAIIVEILVKTRL